MKLTNDEAKKIVCRAKDLAKLNKQELTNNTLVYVCKMITKVDGRNYPKLVKALYELS